MEKVKPLRPKSQFCLQGILSNEEGLLCSVGCKVNLQILIAVVGKVCYMTKNLTKKYLVEWF
jgi:hypothetical protein